jgi:hypothetical protein
MGRYQRAAVTDSVSTRDLLSRADRAIRDNLDLRSEAKRLIEAGHASAWHGAEIRNKMTVGASPWFAVEARERCGTEASH